MRNECKHGDGDKVTVISFTGYEIEHVPKSAPLEYVGDGDKVNIDETKEKVSSIIASRRLVNRIVDA